LLEFHFITLAPWGNLQMNFTCIRTFGCVRYMPNRVRGNFDPIHRFVDYRLLKVFHVLLDITENRVLHAKH
jgi:hypothetical protein